MFSVSLIDIICVQLLHKINSAHKLFHAMDGYLFGQKVPFQLLSNSRVFSSEKYCKVGSLTVEGGFSVPPGPAGAFILFT